MSVLSRFEQAIERLIEGNAFRFFGGDLQPVEIAKRLARAMESDRQIAPHGPIAPNSYEVRLSQSDYDRFADRRGSLERELEDYLIQAAGQRGVRLDRRPTVQLSASEVLRRHQLSVDTRYTDNGAADNLVEAGFTTRLRVGPASAKALPSLRLIDPNLAGEIAVDRLPFSIGRGQENDLTLADRRVSRNHGLIKEIAGRVCLEDLGSTNGTFVNGRRVRQSVLADGDAVSLGGYGLTVSLGTAR